jgi:hypothetical protein
MQRTGPLGERKAFRARSPSQQTKPLEIALEKMPTPLPDEVPAVAAAAAADAVAKAEAIKH